MSQKSHEVKLISNKYLKKLGFVETKTRVFELGDFKVVLTEDRERPQIIVDGRLRFPGAYTKKDLTDLMFFYYDEDRYNEIVKTKS